MNPMMLLGFLAAGILLGWIGGFLWAKERSKTASVAVGIVSILFGHGVSDFLTPADSQRPAEFYAYFVGLLAGFAIAQWQRRRDQRLEDAKKLIVSHIRNKIKEATGKPGFSMMTFQTLREDLHKPGWPDDFFQKIIDAFPEEVTNRHLKNGPGMGLLTVPLELSAKVYDELEDLAERRNMSGPELVELLIHQQQKTGAASQ